MKKTKAALAIAAALTLAASLTACGSGSKEHDCKAAGAPAPAIERVSFPKPVTPVRPITPVRPYVPKPAPAPKPVPAPKPAAPSTGTTTTPTGMPWYWWIPIIGAGDRC